MKNKILRLAIVAVLVVAMVLSMAACDKTVPVEPGTSPDKPITSPSVAPVSPSVTPVVSSDEAALESKYGITFPVANDMVIDFEKDAANLVVVSETGTPKFFAQAPDYNDAYNAYKAGITVGIKVTGMTKEGEKISPLEEITGGDNEWKSYIPKAAGTYTVVYSIAVVYNAPDDLVGYFKPTKISEKYSVTKTYEVAKKAIAIESVSDAFERVEGFNFPIAEFSYKNAKGTEIKNAEQIKAISGSYTIAKKPSTLSIDNTTANLSIIGTYPLALVCKNSGGSEVDVSTIVSNNFDFTFKNGNRYVVTEAEKAAAEAAVIGVENAAIENAGKDFVEVGVSIYAALTPGAKALFAKDAKNLENIVKMNANNEALAKISLVEEAKKLAKVWNGVLLNEEAEKAFIKYILELPEGDRAFVEKALGSAAAGDVSVKALGRVAAYESKMLEAFNEAETAFKTAETAIIVNADNTYTKEKIDNLTKAYKNVEIAFNTLSTVQKAKTKDEVKNSVIVKRAEYFVKEMTARFSAYMTLVDGLDAYTDNKKVTLNPMTNLLGYSFENKNITKGDGTAKNASKVIFKIVGSEKGNYITFETPLLFVAEEAKIIKNLVNSYVALDAAIVGAHTQLTKDLGIWLGAAASTKPDDRVESFDGNDFVVTTKVIAKLDALKNFITAESLKGINDANGAPFGDSKKDLTTIIAKAVGDSVKTVNAFIKDWKDKVKA